jgi:hypothetical protein
VHTTLLERTGIVPVGNPQLYQVSNRYKCKITFCTGYPTRYKCEYFYRGCYASVQIVLSLSIIPAPLPSAIPIVSVHPPLFPIFSSLFFFSTLASRITRMKLTQISQELSHMNHKNTFPQESFTNILLVY